MTQTTLKLPKPDSFSQEHSEQVRNYIQNLIRRSPEQRISFAEFMKQALYAPGLGYYAVDNRKFGKEGDFITAPEVSELFGQCLALQIKQILQHLPGSVILEFGAGTGKMALDIMQTLALENSLPDKYYIVEISAALKQRQQEFLQFHAPALFHHFEWLSNLPDKPINAVILANEVLDAMPFHRFHFENQLIQEWYVVNNGLAFDWALAEPSSNSLKEKIKALDLPQQLDYTSEINLMQSAWIHTISDCLNQGVVLLIDYGYPEIEYYHPERRHGTMKCFFRHYQHEDPLILTGIQDITAHVNFTAIARAAVEVNLNVLDYTTQASFLLNCGIERQVNCIHDQLSKINAVQQLKKLTLPTEMGELFKVIALSRKIDFELVGFQQFSQLKTL